MTNCLTNALMFYKDNQKFLVVKYDQIHVYDYRVKLNLVKRKKVQIKQRLAILRKLYQN